MAALDHTTKLLAGKSDPEKGELWLPLWMHMRDTAEVMRLLVLHWLPEAVRRSIGLEEELLLQTAVFLGGVHDIGKAIALFQSNIMRRIPEACERLDGKISLMDGGYKPAKTPHARASEAILLSLGCPKGLASIAGAHHGKPQQSGLEQYVEEHIECYPADFWGPKAYEAQWREIWQKLYRAALTWSGFSCTEELPRLSIPAEVLLTGLLTMADWIASNTRYFPLVPVQELGDEAWYPKRVQRGWEQLELTSPWSSETYTMPPEHFQNRFGFAPNAIQRAVLEIAADVQAPGIMIIEAQMGVGKTEAALAAAEIFAARFQEGGLYFGLPTQATANGIFGRLAQWAGSQSEQVAHSIRLAHGMAELNEDYQQFIPGRAVTEEDEPQDEQGGNVFVHQWFQGSKQALLADFVIGTVDQLLMAALKQKHVMLRHLGLAGKVVIVDECHAYDAYMNRYLDTALCWLGSYRVPVILLSATLPAYRRAKLVETYLGHKTGADAWKQGRSYPLLTWTDGDRVCQQVVPLPAAEHKVACSMVTQDMLPTLLSAKLQGGGCAGVIVNTVHKAQAIASVLQQAMPEFEIVLFHAQFVATDRAEKERYILAHLGKTSTDKQRDKLIVVGTQVLEQSLDIDFDFLVAELCPMDLLLQRIGRLQRHIRPNRPPLLQSACCAVLIAADDAFDPGSKAVYGEWLLWRTRQLLPPVISLPGDIAKLVQDTYAGAEEDPLPLPASSEAKEKYTSLQREKENKAGIHVILRPDEHINLLGEDDLDDWMQDTVGEYEAAARAAVRDGEPSIEVLVMMRDACGQVRFLPWQNNGRAVAADRPPSVEESRAIARQRLRLPSYFGRRWNVEQVIRELEQINRTVLAQWQQAPLLKGELVLLLEQDLTMQLAQTVLHYDKAQGLTWKKEEADADERDRV